jgi:hypothetical protein
LPYWRCPLARGLVLLNHWKKFVEWLGKLLKKCRQFQERVPDSPSQWNAHDEPVNEKFEPVIGRLISLSHGKRSLGYRFCL